MNVMPSKLNFVGEAVERPMLLIQQIRSVIRKHKRHSATLATLIGLGLGKLNRFVILPDEPRIRGMIRRVDHVVRVRDGNNLTADALRMLAKARKRDAYPRKLEPTWLLQQRLNRYRELLETDVQKAAVKGSVIMAMVRERPDGIANFDGVARRDFDDVVRGLYRAMYGRDPSVARQAAYALVANSSTHGKGLDPSAHVSQLSHSQAERFRRGLVAMLSRSGVTCLTSITAKVSNKMDEGLAVVAVTLAVNRTLPFQIDGKEVPLSGLDTRLLDEENVVIGCPLAERVVSFVVDTHVDMRTALSAKAEFAVPEEVLEQSDIPISLMMPGIFENQQVKLSARDA